MVVSVRVATYATPKHEVKMPFYPKITEDSVLTMTLVRQNLENDPKYLDHKDCPYSDVIKKFFRVGIVPLQAETTDIFADGNDLETVEQQIKLVLSDLGAMAAQMIGADTNERLNYLRIKTPLLEKLIAMQERIFNLKELAQFRTTVLNGLEEICDKDQITRFMRHLDGILGVEIRE